MADLDEMLQPLTQHALREPTPVETLHQRARRRRWRRRMRVAGVALCAGATFAAVAVVSLDGSGSDPVQVAGPEESQGVGAGVIDMPATERFVPPVSRDGDREVLALTMLDGSVVELSYPADLDLASLGFESHVAVEWDDGAACCGRRVSVLHAGIDVFGLQAPRQVLTRADGSEVALFDVREGGADASAEATTVLVVPIGSWLVVVPTSSPGLTPLSERQVATLAQGLTGHETSDGFLVLEPTSPLRLNHIDSPLGQLGDGAISLSPLEACPPAPDVNDRGYGIVDYGEPGVSICAPDLGVAVTVGRRTGLARPLVDELEIREVRPGALAPARLGVSDGEPPSTEDPAEQTGAEPVLSGALLDGRSWRIAHEPLRGLCVWIDDADIGCDDVGPVIPTDANPARPRLASDGQGAADDVGEGQAGQLAYAFLPTSATDVVLVYADGRTSSDGLVLDTDGGVWAIPIQPSDTPASVQYTDASGSTVVTYDFFDF